MVGGSDSECSKDKGADRKQLRRKGGVHGTLLVLCFMVIQGHSLLLYQMSNEGDRHCFAGACDTVLGGGLSSSGLS